MKKMMLLLAAGSVVLMLGCVNEAVDGEIHTYTMAAWVSLGTLAACLVGTIAGWFLRSVNTTYGWGLLMICPLALVFAVPGLFMDKLTVDNEGFNLRTGFWFAPTKHDIKFDDLQSMQVTKKETQGRRGRTNISYTLGCVPRGGQMIDVSIGTLMDKGMEQIIMRAVDKEIPIADLTGE